jgi:hypothetical protein
LSSPELEKKLAASTAVIRYGVTFPGWRVGFRFGSVVDFRVSFSAKRLAVERRFAADDESSVLAAGGGDFPLEGVGVAGVKIALRAFPPLGIDDTDVHRVGMQVDPAVE